MNVERFDLAAVAAQPWKNGAGLTREIARGGPHGVDFDWRISLAEVARDAPFSAFPGVDRCIVLLRGAGMTLKSADGSVDHRLSEPLVPFHFSGDVALDATLAGGASSDFNVMTRRGHLRSEVSCHREASTLPGALITLLLCAEGEWVVETDDEPQRLEPLQALLWREPLASVKVWPSVAGTPSSILLVRLSHDLNP
jgi:environmental stress-induced protein Ves